MLFPLDNSHDNLFCPGRRGVTLVELLIVLVIMSVVMATAFTLFQVSISYETHLQEVLTQTQNQRAALYAVARTVRMAGSGLGMVGVRQLQLYAPPDFDPKGGTVSPPSPRWLKYDGANKTGAWPIYFTDSDTDSTKSDTLTVLWTNAESPIPLGQLSKDFKVTDVVLHLDTEVRNGWTLNNRDMLAVANGTTAVVVQAKLNPALGSTEMVPAGLTEESYLSPVGAPTSDISIGARFKPEALPGIDDFTQVFPAGSKVYNLRDVNFVTYQVDRMIQGNTPILRLIANYHDKCMGLDPDTLSAACPNTNGTNYILPVAGDIEDFQVGYYYSSVSESEVIGPIGKYNANSLESIFTSDINTQHIVRAVELAVVARSQSKSTLEKNGRPVEVMGHIAGEDKPDGYARRVLTETVQLRNYGPDI